MTTYRMSNLSRLSDSVLLQTLVTLLAKERGVTAVVLAYLAEVDGRRLYLPAGYPSMYEFCVRELHLSEDAAFKRIRAARAACEFPVLFAALESGALHLSAIVLLTPHLTPETVDALVAAATHKTKAQIEQLLAERFPRPDLPTLVQVIAEPVQPCETQLAPGPVAVTTPEHTNAPVPPVEPARREVDVVLVKPLAPQRYSLQLTMDQDTHDMLRHAQELLGHEIPTGDVAEVLERALRLLVAHLEKRKFAATPKPRQTPRHLSENPRHIAAAVKRAVWARDGGQCTFVSGSGRRCPSRTRLEFDHVEPVARGGDASLPSIRLRCRAHNQYTAECEFGAEFMRHKREARREAREAACLESA